MQRVKIRYGKSLVALAATATLLLLPQAAEAQSSFPEDAVEALKVHEADLEKWHEGPVSYILTDDERDLWRELGTDEERADFIEWFWERRDEDLRDEGNSYKEMFYERVAQANDRYYGLPRGWRSDQGRVHVVLGKPHAIRPVFGVPNDGVVWTYYTVGPRAEGLGFDSSIGEFTIAFVRRAPRVGYEIYGGFGGPGILPRYVRDALRFAADASIVNPFIEANID